MILVPYLFPCQLPANSPRVQEVDAAAGKQRAAAAAELETLREAMAARAAEVGKKIERSSKKMTKLPEIAQVLQPFLS